MREYYDKLGNLEIVDVYETGATMPVKVTFESGRGAGEKLFRIRNTNGHTLADGYVRKEHLQEVDVLMDYLKARSNG